MTSVDGVSLRLSLSFTFVKVLCVGIYEEFLSRGYHLRNLSEGLNPRLGVLVSAAIFSLLHAANPNTTVMSVVALFVNALWFTAGLLATGRLSAAIGMHIAWNLFQGAVLGFPVSGDKEGASIVSIQQLGPEFVTGGAFGPEGGLIGIVASLLGIAVFVLGWRKQPPR